MKLKLFFLVFPLLVLSYSVHSQDLQTPTSAPAAHAPTDTPTPISGKKAVGTNTAKALIVHKPKPSPSWGKVIQYHREVILALTESNRETLHEFVFQDDDGIIRTAIFHENSSGDGYWEVWVWDQQ